MNAVYFKGIWRAKFEKKDTFEPNFTDESGAVTKVNMMYQKDTFGYTSDALAQYLDMPYGNKAFSMTVVLPKAGVTTQDVLTQLTAQNWESSLAAMRQRQVDVYLPRFKVENTFSLIEVLETMGMPVEFTDNADFSGISDERLFISNVVHKTYVTVDEEGTEAAAVTSVEFTTTSIEVPVTPVVNVDRPFIFVIREKSTGAILFIAKMGKVTKY